MKQTIQYQLINPSGNLTAIVPGKYSSNKKQIINQAIFNQNKNVEQIGYVYEKNSQKYFEMMGNEFSANGCRAAGYYFVNNTSGSTAFFTSGLNQNVEVKISDNQSTLIFTKEIKSKFINNKTVIFGTTFYLINSLPDNQKITRILKSKAKIIGIMFYQKNIIYPYFFVPTIGKIIFEQSCGSGSIALALFTGQNKIIQPSGEILIINKEPLSLSGSITNVGNYNVKIKL
ncbi:hypothetical protein KBC75_05585 [Candidatus Shapirobacteria bacterium]|nr:hypothetical protein [Candidatus Shapirobacteria bacterium]